MTKQSYRRADCGSARVIASILLVLCSVVGSESAVAQSFGPTGNLNTGRNGHRAITLNNGTVLITGGYDFRENALASSELFDPATGTFTPTGSLNTARRNFSITLLDNGTVFVAGGYDANFNILASAEIYDPSTGVFTPTGSLNTSRADHTATLLNDGTVLIAGGFDSTGNALVSAELYLPSTGTFVQTGNLNNARGFFTATALMDGTVLIEGGWAGAALSSAEIYNPLTASFSTTGNLNIGRVRNTATLLNGGEVLIAGGKDSSGNILGSAELYSPATGSFTPTGSLNAARGDHAATLLTNGTVLVDGGFACDPSNCVATEIDASTSAEVYDPATGAFSVTGSMASPRQVHTSTLLPDGSILAAGGWSNSNPALTTAEIYQPATFTPQNLVSISVGPASPSLFAGTSQALAATGMFADNSIQTLASVVWNSSDNTVATVSNDSGSNSGMTNDSTNSGVVYGLAPGTATVSACSGLVCGSTTVTVLPLGSAQGLVVKASPVTVTVAAGGTTTLSILLMPENQRSSQTVTLTCTGVPPGARCTVSPSTLRLSGTINASATATIATTAPAALSNSVVGPKASVGRQMVLVAVFSIGFGLCFITSRRTKTASAALVTIVLISQMLGCGGPNSSTGQRVGTPVGTYEIVVTGTSGGVTSSAQFNLIVQ